MTVQAMFAMDSSERAPLLAREPTGSDSLPHLEKFVWRKWLRNFSNPLCVPTIDYRFRFVPLLGCLIILTNEIEYFVKHVSTMRMIEAMYCIEYYAVEDPSVAYLGKHIPERLCKNDLIQKQLASTTGLTMFFRMLCAIIGAIPLGYLADKKGRKIVLVLHKLTMLVSGVSQILIYFLYPSLPIWTLYLTGLPSLVGGNFDLGLAILFSSIADVVPSDSDRASLFLLTTSMQYVGQAVCPPLGGWLMNLDAQGGTPWAAHLASIGASVFAVCLTVFAFPETLGQKPDQKSLGSGLDHVGNVEAGANDEKPGRGLAYGVMLWFKRSRNHLQIGVAGIGVGSVFLLGLSMMCAAIGIKSIDWYGLVQYPVIKFGWTYPQASSVISIQALVTLFNFSFILPLWMRLGTKHFAHPSQSSLAIMVGSAFVLTVGTVMLGFSNTNFLFFLSMIVYTLGEGLPVATQTYIASLIAPSRLARVMSALSIAATSGKLFAAGLFPQVLAIGLDTHVESLVGLPFFVAAGLFVVAGICIVLSVGLRKSAVVGLEYQAVPFRQNEERGDLDV